MFVVCKLRARCKPISLASVGSAALKILAHQELYLIQKLVLWDLQIQRSRSLANPGIAHPFCKYAAMPTRYSSTSPQALLAAVNLPTIHIITCSNTHKGEGCTSIRQAPKKGNDHHGCAERLKKVWATDTLPYAALAICNLQVLLPEEHKTAHRNNRGGRTCQKYHSVNHGMGRTSHHSLQHWEVAHNLDVCRLQRPPATAKHTPPSPRICSSEVHHDKYLGVAKRHSNQLQNIHTIVHVFTTSSSLGESGDSTFRQSRCLCNTTTISRTSGC